MLKAAKLGSESKQLQTHTRTKKKKKKSPEEILPGHLLSSSPHS